MAFDGRSNAKLIPLVHTTVLESRLLGRLISVLLLFFGFGVMASANDFPVHITLSPTMRKVIEDAKPEDRQRLIRAINIGNKFIRLQFSNQVSYDPETHDEWNKTIGPLMAMNGETWAKMSDGLETYVLIGKYHTGSLLACPSIELSKVDNDQGVLRISYTANLIGVASDIWSKRPYFMDSMRSGQPYRVTVQVNKDYRVSTVQVSEKVYAWVYTYHRKAVLESMETSKVQQAYSKDGAEVTKGLEEQIKRIDAAALKCHVAKLGSR